MSSLLPRSTLRPCSWWACQRYVGAPRICSWSVSMRRPLNACATCFAPSRPTGATTLTGTIKLAARAKYTAEPPSTSSTLPNGPSRVSSATEPATRSCGCFSGTAARTAAGLDDMACITQLLQEVRRVGVIADLHPAPTELLNRVRIRSCRGNLAEIGRKPGSGHVGGRVAPRVIRLDDVDAVCEFHHSLGPEVCPETVHRVRDVGQATHLVNDVHHFLGHEVRGQAARDEQPDHLALARFRLLTDDRQLRSHSCQLERAFDRVVVGQRNPVEADLRAAFAKRRERAPAVVRKDRVKVKVDP